MDRELFFTLMEAGLSGPLSHEIIHSHPNVFKGAVKALAAEYGMDVAGDIAHDKLIKPHPKLRKRYRRYIAMPAPKTHLGKFTSDLASIGAVHHALKASEKLSSPKRIAAVALAHALTRSAVNRGARHIERKLSK